VITIVVPKNRPRPCITGDHIQDATGTTYRVAAVVPHGVYWKILAVPVTAPKATNETC